MWKRTLPECLCKRGNNCLVQTSWHTTWLTSSTWPTWPETSDSFPWECNTPSSSSRQPPPSFSSTLSAAGPSSPMGRRWSAWASLQTLSPLLCYLLVLTYSITLAPIAWVYATEVWSLETCFTGMALASIAYWLFNFAIGSVIPPVFENVSWKLFVIFGVLCFGDAVQALLHVPGDGGQDDWPGDSAYPDNLSECYIAPGRVYVIFVWTCSSSFLMVRWIILTQTVNNMMVWESKWEGNSGILGFLTMRDGWWWWWGSRRRWWGSWTGDLFRSGRVGVW